MRKFRYQVAPLLLAAALWAPGAAGTVVFQVLSAEVDAQLALAKGAVCMAPRPDMGGRDRWEVIPMPALRRNHGLLVLRNLTGAKWTLQIPAPGAAFETGGLEVYRRDPGSARVFLLQRILGPGSTFPLEAQVDYFLRPREPFARTVQLKDEDQGAQTFKVALEGAKVSFSPAGGAVQACEDLVVITRDRCAPPRP